MATAAALTTRGQLASAVARLAAAGVETPRANAEWLLADLLGVRRPELYRTRALDPAVAARYAAAVARRAAREPLQRIIGWEEFRGLRVALTDAVLVPRPETEVLAGWALELLPPPGARPPLVLDAGTGSGCIAVSVAAERPDARVLAVDVSPAAAVVARANARALGVADRVAVVVADLLSAIGSARVDLVVANPPYLPSALIPDLAPEVATHEPRAALDGGDDGLAVIRRLAAEAPRVLRAGGVLVLETGGGPQLARVAALLAAAGFTAIATRRDLAGVERFVAGRAPAP